MNIFQTVKENVTARQAAEQYGLKVNKNGMVCCPFHDDRHPSMKVDRGFCCFACGAKGDVITFVADFFHLAPLEAAKKLAEDFQIPVFTDNARKRNASKKKEKPKRTFYQTEKKFEEWETGKYPYFIGLIFICWKEMENKIRTKNTRGRMESRIYRSLPSRQKR